MDGHDALDARAQDLGERWLAEMEGEPEGVRRATAFLMTMALVNAGAYRLLFRGERDGRRVLIAMDPFNEQAYELLDPEYGEAEDAAVAEMMGVLRLAAKL